MKPHYWTEEHNELCDSAKDFNELLRVALVVLSELKTRGKPVIEVCGPLSTGGRGSYEENSRYYNHAVKVLESKEMLVFNPSPFQNAMERLSSHLKNGEYCMDILNVFYRGIFSSGHISKAYFLPDWQSSKGATWEREAVQQHGIEIIDIPQEWLGDFK